MGPAILAAGLWASLVAPPPPGIAIDASVPVSRRLVGDWEPADAYAVTLAAGWPHTYEPLLDALAERAQVVVFVQRGAGKNAAHRFIDGLSPTTRERISLQPDAVDSPWVRDYGPMQTREAGGEIRWLDPDYGGRPRDDAVPSRLAESLSMTVESLPLSLDGGAIVSDGRGHCVSTFDYLQIHHIDRFAADFAGTTLPTLGCASLLLVHALLDEDTAHVDMFLQFLDTTTVAVSSMSSELDPEQAARLDSVAAAVQAFATRRELPWTVVRVPMGMDLGGDLLPYVNGIHVHDAFLMPSYYETPTATETKAADALAAAMPGVSVIRIPAAEMADLGGALHCAVMGVRTR